MVSTKSLAFWIAVACGVATIASAVAVQGAPDLMLHPPRVGEEPWTPITFLFVGRGPWFGGLFAALCFYQFGREVERYLGAVKFAGMVVTAALAAAAVGYAGGLPEVGAAGATAAGVLVAYMRMWPVNRVSLFGWAAFRARDLLIVYVGYSLLGSVGGGQLRWDGLIPAAGAAAALLFLVVIDRDSAGAKFRQRLDRALYGDGSSRNEIDWEGIPRDGLHGVTLEELERIEAKARASGIRALTPDERAFVHRLQLRRSA
jgi:membrane associated rhomboid family serine protease